jgi:hypothetical protein
MVQALFELIPCDVSALDAGLHRCRHLSIHQCLERLLVWRDDPAQPCCSTSYRRLEYSIGLIFG